MLLMRVASLGWSLRNSAVLLPPDAAIRCQKETATLGSYPAIAAKMSPMRSASVSWSREFGGLFVVFFCI